MQIAAGGFASVEVASLLVDTDAGDATAVRPILTEINNVDARALVQMDSLQIQDTIGQPVTASFVIVSPIASAPQVGDQIRIRYYEQLIFAGTIDTISQTVQAYISGAVGQSAFFSVQCKDWSQILFRRVLRRNFTSLPLQTIIDSILDNELAGEGLTIGNIDSRATIYLVDSQDARVFDIFRDAAGSTGQTFYLDFDKSIQMRSTSVLSAPLLLDESNVLFEGTRYDSDRDTYRNQQTIVCAGTPVNDTDVALEVTVVINLPDQIAERQSIEGGTGIYEDVEHITHPTSNDRFFLNRLATEYANLRLSTAGQLPATLFCNVRGYGFRAGQIAVVSLPNFGIADTFIIQRVTIQETSGRYLFHALELTSSSLQQRAYETWLAIVKGGSKVIVQLNAQIAGNLQTFTTVSSPTFVVPAGVTALEITAYSGTGGGGGGAQFNGINGALVFYNGSASPSTVGANGGTGGNGSKVVTLLTVSPGDTLSIVVGAKGVKGTSDANTWNQFMGIGNDDTTATDGTDGGLSSVTYHSVIVAQANGGKKGKKALVRMTRSDALTYDVYTFPGANGAAGGGTGGSVFVGGGYAGGVHGTGNPLKAPTDGHDGLVEIRW